MTSIEGNNSKTLIPRQNQVVPLRDKGLVRAAGRAGLHWFGVLFPPVGPLPKPKAQPQSGIEEKWYVLHRG